MKKIFSAILALLALCGCNSAQEGTSSPPEAADTGAVSINNFDFLEESEIFTNECEITLGDNITINGEGAWLDDNCITISESGIYTLSGELSEGIIYVKSTDTVKLVLNNASVSNKNGAAVIAEKGKLIIECVEGTENFLNDSKDYSYSRPFEDEEKHKAALYTDGDLVICGSGGLSVEGKKSEGIICGKMLFVNGTSLSVSSEDNGIEAAEEFAAVNAYLNVTGGKDCIKTDSENGSVTLSGCTVELSTENDGIQADKAFAADNSVINITTTGNIEADSELSSKGIKSQDITLSGCTAEIKSTDHSIKADGTLSISGGIYTISSSAGKGMTAEGTFTISGADITVAESEEGIESKSTLTIDGGNLNITASDDGINTGGDDNTSDHSMNINGGTIIVNAEGDGLDSNGDINITGGTVVVFGPVSEGNSPVDCGDNGNVINVSGGKLLAVGSAGMMTAPKENYILSRGLNAQAGDSVAVTDGNGNVILGVTLPKSAQGILFSSGDTVDGYKIYKNGTTDGAADENGFITSGSLNGGTEVVTGDAGFGAGKGHGGKNPMGGFPKGDMTPPEMPQGEAPQGDMTPPEMPQGEAPQGDMTPPEMPQGEAPQGDMTPPEMPQGEAPQTTQS